MRTRSPAIRTSRFVLMLTLALMACGSPERAATAPVPMTISPVAAAYLAELVTLLQRYSVKSRGIDWTTFRAQVVAAAGPAQSITETALGIRQALALLGDGHSVYIPLRGSAIAVPTKVHRALTTRQGKLSSHSRRVRAWRKSATDRAS